LYDNHPFGPSLEDTEGHREEKDKAGRDILFSLIFGENSKKIKKYHDTARQGRHALPFLRIRDGPGYLAARRADALRFNFGMFGRTAQN
jgi:hypothetical protein